MGKIKRRRSKNSRYDPLSVSGVKECKDSSSIPEVEINGSGQDFNISGLNSIIGKISNCLPEEKITALNTLAALALEKETSEFLIEQKIVASVAPLLSHNSPKVRLASAGALRNLCISASDDVLEGMISQDIMQPLVNLLKECSNTVTAPESEKYDSLDVNKEIANAMDDFIPTQLIFNQAIHILWNLCEGNECALNTFNQEGLINILLKHINPYIWGYSLALPIAECLLCVTENNENAISSALPIADTFVAILSDSCVNEENPRWLQYAVIMSGVLLNINYCTPGGGNLRITLEILSKSLEVDISSYLNCVNNNSQRTNGHSTPLKELESVLSSQQLALELLSNFCCLGDDDEEYEDLSGDESCDDEAMDICPNFTSDYSPPPEIIEAIKYFQFVEKIKKRINMPIDAFCNDPIERKYQDSLLEKFCQVRIRALQCFQNLTLCLDIEELGGSKELYKMWIEFGSWLCSGNKSDPPLQEAVSGAMRVIIDKLRTGECQQLLNVTNDEIKQIFQACSMCSLGPVRANLARMVGNLGCYLIEKNKEEDITKGKLTPIFLSSTEYLLKVANNDEELFVRAEALDVIIDLFSDDKTDNLALEIHLVDNLKGIQPHFKAKYQKMKKKLGDHRPLVLTVKDNLSSFIKYKSSRVSRHS